MKNLLLFLLIKITFNIYSFSKLSKPILYYRDVYEHFKELNNRYFSYNRKTSSYSFTKEFLKSLALTKHGYSFERDYVVGLKDEYNNNFYFFQRCNLESKIHIESLLKCFNLFNFTPKRSDLKSKAPSNHFLISEFSKFSKKLKISFKIPKENSIKIGNFVFTPLELNEYHIRNSYKFQNLTSLQYSQCDILNSDIRSFSKKNKVFIYKSEQPKAIINLKSRLKTILKANHQTKQLELLQRSKLLALYYSPEPQQWLMGLAKEKNSHGTNKFFHWFTDLGQDINLLFDYEK